MESNAVGSVRYDRWNEDNINMNVEASPSTLRRCDELLLNIKDVNVKSSFKWLSEQFEGIKKKCDN